MNLKTVTPVIEFTDLYFRLDSTTKTNEKVVALVEYLESSDPIDTVWTIYFLMGRRLKRLIGVRKLAEWAVEKTQISNWLFDECYDRVGDLAETISLILPASVKPNPMRLNVLVEDFLLPMQSLDEDGKREVVLELWQRLDQRQLFVLGKLMTGGFRVGVSKKLVTRAISQVTGIDAASIAHRLRGDWQPTESFYRKLIDKETNETSVSKPYPFFLANPIKQEPCSLGDFKDWIAEWKWDGIRAQVIQRESEVFIWSRGEELVTDQFPEVAAAAKSLPDGTVLDGEILGWDANLKKPLEFSQLQRRLGRKKVGKKLLAEVPVALLAFDLIELDGQDIRHKPLWERQQIMAETIGPLGESSICLPPQVSANDWEEAARLREDSKRVRAEGLMLKRQESAYHVGRPVGDWWKWKVDPLLIDAVLIYAQRGHGRRASLYTDYTFAVWKDDQLVPFAKAYSGLTDAEIRKVDAYVRKNTNERFGPVRSVIPELVFELAFENIQRSTRHKSGVAVRFPRINRWRRDKKPQDADHLSTILEMIED